MFLNASKLFSWFWLGGRLISADGVKSAEDVCIAPNVLKLYPLSRMESENG